MPALEYSVRFIILLVAVAVIAAMMLQFSTVSLPSASKSSSKDFPKTVQKAKFSEQEVAKYMADCYSALSSDKSLENDKVCYILDSSGNFEYLNEALIMEEIKKAGQDINAEIIANYSYRPLIIIYERLKRLVVLTHRPRECYISMDCKQRPFEDCTRNVCYRGFCWYRAQCPYRGECTEGQTDYCNFCPHGATETKCSDGIDNDCDGRIDGQDSDCGGGGQCSERRQECTNLACCAGLACKQDRWKTPNGPADRCCRSDECLADGGCVPSGTTANNQTCRNGEWVPANVSSCSDEHGFCYNNICCSGLTCKASLPNPYFNTTYMVCCKPNECAFEGCVPEGYIYGNMSCHNGVWGYNGTAVCAIKTNFCGGYTPCCSGLACKQDTFYMMPQPPLLCCSPGECSLGRDIYPNGTFVSNQCYSDGTILNNQTCTNGRWVPNTQCPGRRALCDNQECCNGLVCRSELSSAWPKRCCLPNEFLSHGLCQPRGTIQ